MFTVSNQHHIYSILNDWCILINVSCGEELLKHVLQQCDQRELMRTLTGGGQWREDLITPEEQFFISNVLYACLSPVKPSMTTRIIQTPRPLKEAKASETGLGDILPLRVPLAPGTITKFCELCCCCASNTVLFVSGHDLL